MHCNAIFENYTETNYNISSNNTSEKKFISILQPLLAMIQHKLKGNYLYGEEYLIKFLQENRQNITGEDILDLSRHMSTCVAHLYLILTTMILSIIIGFPLACCMKICYNKVSNPEKHQYRFFSQCVVFAVAMGFLLVGCLTSWNIGLKSQAYLESFPKEITTITSSWHKAKFEFHKNCERLHSTIEINLENISNITRNIYDDILNIVDEKTQIEYTASIWKYDNITRHIKEAYRNLEFQTQNEISTGKIIILGEELNNLKRKFNGKLHDIIMRKNFTFPENESMYIDVILPGNYTYPDWHEIYYELKMILIEAFPNMNATIYVIDSLKQNLKGIYDKNIANLTQHIKKIQDLSNSTSNNLTKAMDSVSSYKYEKLVMLISLRLEKMTSYSLFSSNKNTTDISSYFKLTTWILVFPSIYGFIVFFFFTSGFIGTCREMQNASNGKVSVNSVYAITLFKIATRVAITFLWLILLVTSALYILHVPTMVLCGAVAKEKLVDRYLDRPYWNNDSWIKYNLNKLLPRIKNSITIKSFMSECSLNKTIIKSLKLEEYISNETIQDDVNRAMEKLKEYFPETFEKQSFADFESITMRIEYLDYLMEVEFIPDVERDLGNIENRLVLSENFLLDGNLTDYRDIKQIINDIRKGILEMRLSIEDFIVAKFLVTVTKNEIHELQLINGHLENLTKFDVFSNVNEYLDRVTDNIKCLHNELEMFTKQSLLYDFGKCNFLPYAYNKLKWIVCDYGLELVNAFWLSLVILSFSIVIATILACRIACYVRGSYKIHNHQYLLNRRYSSRRPDTNNNVEIDSDRQISK